MWSQYELTCLPTYEVREFGLTHYGHVKEGEEGVVHVYYEELAKDENPIAVFCQRERLATTPAKDVHLCPECKKELGL